MLLSQTTHIEEQRNFGKETVRQSLDITVDYNPDDDTFNVLFCSIIQGPVSMDITKLLEEAPGNPLNTIVETIDWQELCSETLNTADHGQ